MARGKRVKVCSDKVILASKGPVFCVFYPPGNGPPGKSSSVLSYSGTAPRSRGLRRSRSCAPPSRSRPPPLRRPTPPSLRWASCPLFDDFRRFPDFHEFSRLGFFGDFFGDFRRTL
eukprot:1265916-Pyramimonas_sp.AAC.1